MDIEDLKRFVSKINELDVDGVEPLHHPAELYNVFRSDIIMPSLTHKEVFKNAPEEFNGFFVVPKVVD